MKTLLSLTHSIWPISLWKLVVFSLCPSVLNFKIIFLSVSLFSSIALSSWCVLLIWKCLSQYWETFLNHFTDNPSPHPYPCHSFWKHFYFFGLVLKFSALLSGRFPQFYFQFFSGGISYLVFHIKYFPQNIIFFHSI